MKKKSGPKVDRFGTPVKTGLHEKDVKIDHLKKSFGVYPIGNFQEVC